MSTNDIPLDKAELLSVLLEALLYGFSLFMFGGTIWALSSQRSTRRLNRKMFTAACSLLLFSTVHLVIDIIRIMEGFLSFRDSESSLLYFSNVSHWTFVSKNYVYAAQTLIGDGVLLYRCYAVWQSKLAMIFPALFWCTAAVTGFACPYVESQVTEGGVFVGKLSRWIISFWASTLATNMVTTLMLAYRIWYVDWKATKLCDHRKSELRPMLHVIIDAGLIYSLTLFAALICYVNKSNGQYVMLDMIMPIISITFYMVIIRVGLANRANHPTNALSLGHSSSSNVFSGDRGSKFQVDIMEFGGRRNSQRSSVGHCPMGPIRDNNHRSEIKFDNIEEEV